MEIQGENRDKGKEKKKLGKQRRGDKWKKEEEEKRKAVEKRNGGVGPRSKEVNQSKGRKT